MKKRIHHMRKSATRIEISDLTQVTPLEVPPLEMPPLPREGEKDPYDHQPTPKAPPTAMEFPTQPHEHGRSAPQM